MRALPRHILTGPLLVLLLAFVAGLTFAGQAEATEKQASFVIDGNTGAVLHDQAGDEPRYPASLTKMMTLYLAFAEIEAGRMSNDTVLTVSANAASMAPSKLELDMGERISLGDAIKAVVTKSANDMAVAIAEAIAGSEAEFARRMTKRAREIGMSNTTFRNASGLPDPRQITTAHDMVTLGLRLRDDFPNQFPIFLLRSFTYAGKTHRSHNTLMKGFVGMDGIKTGYTRASGFNLVSSVQRDGKYIVGAVFGGVSASVRNAHMRMILFRALASASTEKTRKAGPVLIARGPAMPQTAPREVADAGPVKPPKPQPVKLAAKPQVPAKQQASDPLAATIAQAPPPAPNAGSASDPVEPAIKIAKVRAVMVAGDTAAAPNGDAPGAAPKRRFTTASATPQFAFAAPAAPAPGPQQDDAAAQAPARQPGTLEGQVAAFSPSPAKPAALGLRPAAQPNSSEAPAVAGGYQIQVGSFITEDEAQKHLLTVRGRAGELLKDRRGVAQQAQVGSKQVFRARFAEFDSAGATAACTTLKQQKVDCMVLRSQ